MTNRREVMKATLAFAVRSAAVPGIGVSLASCGGGGPASVPAPSALSYASPQRSTVGTAITPLSPTVTGSVTDYSVSPALPAGLSLNATTGVISGTPMSATAQNTYTVSAANASGSVTFGILLTVNPALAITGVSSTTPTALTPLSIMTVGLDTSSSFTVTLNTATNVSVALPVISAQSAAGIVVVAVPFYFDPNQLITTAFTATIAITQATVTSNLITLNIADLPSVVGYMPGWLSSNFLANTAMTYAATANGLQAVQALSPSNSNSSVAVTFAKKYVTSTLLMKNDIDTLTSNTASQLAVGTAADGTAVVLDQSSFSLMDRIINLHLQNIANAAAASTSVSQIQHAKIQERPQDLAGIITGLGISSNIIAFQNAKTAFVNSEDGIDEFIALGQGVGAALGIIGAIPGLGEVGVAAQVASATVGTAYGLLACASDLGSCIGYSMAASDAAAQGNQAGFAATQAQLAQAEKNLTTDVLGTVISVVDLGAKGIGGVSGEALNVLQSATDGGAPGVVIKGVELFNNLLTDAVQNDGVNLNNYLDQIGVSNQEIPPTANSFFVAAGNTIGYSTSDLIYPLTGTQLADPATGDTFNGLAGLDSNYELTVPVNAPGIDYSNLQLTPCDPLSGSQGVGGSVDLSGATDSDVVTLPNITSSGLGGGGSIIPCGAPVCSTH